MMAFRHLFYPDNVTSMSATAESFHSATNYQHHVRSTESPHEKKPPSGHLNIVLGELWTDEKGMGKRKASEVLSIGSDW